MSFFCLRKKKSKYQVLKPTQHHANIKNEKNDYIKYSQEIIHIFVDNFSSLNLASRSFQSNSSGKIKRF